MGTQRLIIYAQQPAEKLLKEQRQEPSEEKGAQFHN